MKLKKLIKLPEEKRSGIAQPCLLNGYRNGFNWALVKIGNLELELDVEKIIEIIKKGDPYNIDALAQAIADNFKEIIK